MSNSKNFFRASAEDFKKIPGSPIAYWVSDSLVKAFATLPPLGNVASAKTGMRTGDNERFMRVWSEVGYSKFQHPGDFTNAKKWVPYNKGVGFRKWYGNFTYVINWDRDGYEIKKATLEAYPQLSWDNLGWKISNEQLFYKAGVTWTDISTSAFGVRYLPEGYIFDASGPVLFSKKDKVYLGLLASRIAFDVFRMLNPTMHFKNYNIEALPCPTVDDDTVESVVDKLIQFAQNDWNSYETSWDFKGDPLVAAALRSSNSSESLTSAPVGTENPVNPVENNGASGVRALSVLYAALREKWATSCEEMRRLEIENNRIFIEAYGLQDELTPDVPWNEITLTCNPWYRYGKTAPKGDSNEFPIDAELESRLKGDTVKELILYAVGCMMGRYSIDKPGLILADQGATLQDYFRVVSGQWPVGSTHLEPSVHCPLPTTHFLPDEDGIIPILDNDWFADDIVTRFKEFVKVVFGEEHYFENMAWIEDALGKDIRSYFTKDFYKDHLQRYQNRPIYWLFQSPKGAFRALVYMHRYKPDMVGGVLGYLRSLQTKIDNQLDVAMQIGMDETKSASERVRANKDAVRFAKAKKELDEYERNVLYPLSTERIEIDLDDGVKVNYRKFGAALRKVDALNKE